jgi:hypothetical protein
MIKTRSKGHDGNGRMTEEEERKGTERRAAEEEGEDSRKRYAQPVHSARYHESMAVAIPPYTRKHPPLVA